MAGKKRIDAYLDCNSPYSLFAFTWLKRNQELLTAHDVAVEFHPIFLGGINVGSGNKPPWTLPAKAAHGKFDRARAERYFGVEELTAPPFFPILSLLPLRCMLYIQQTFDTARYEAQFFDLWTCYWREHMDISKPEIMLQCLKRNFSDEEAAATLEAAKTEKYKKMLMQQTAMLVEKGAYGAPWFLVRNGHGKEEGFFGSDRFPYMLQYLGVPFQDIAILAPSNDAKL